MDELDYANDVQIDPDALDTEWLVQPDLMRRYTTYAAQAKRAMDDAKERLDIVRAQLEMLIRNDPRQFGLEKVTEGAITSAVTLQSEYQQASKALVDARYEFEMAQAAVRALDTKKASLENLVKLLGMSYFAGPKAPHDLTQDYTQRIEQRRSNMKVKIGNR